MNIIAQNNENYDFIYKQVQSDNTLIYSMLYLDLIPVIQINPDSMCLEDCNDSACVFLCRSQSQLKNIHVSKTSIASDLYQADNESVECVTHMSKYAFQHNTQEGILFWIDANSISSAINNERKLYLFNLNNLLEPEGHENLSAHSLASSSNFSNNYSQENENNTCAPVKNSKKYSL